MWKNWETAEETALGGAVLHMTVLFSHFHVTGTKRVKINSIAPAVNLLLVKIIIIVGDENHLEIS